MIIGITGISGSGTSTVSAILEEIHGGFVISADKLAHEVILKGQPAYDQLLAIFGQDILQPNGEIDRKALGTKVFGDGEKLAVLEAIIHPHVIAKTQQLLAQAAAQGFPFAVIDAPLLIEAGMHNMCHTVWLVTAPEATRRERIMSRDGIDGETAGRRLQSRVGDDALLPHAHTVIENAGDLAGLRQMLMQMIERTLNPT